MHISENTFFNLKNYDFLMVQIWNVILFVVGIKKQVIMINYK